LEEGYIEFVENYVGHAKDVVFLVGTGRSCRDKVLEFLNREFEKDIPQLDGMTIVHNDNESMTMTKKAENQGGTKHGLDDNDGAGHHDEIFLEALLNASQNL
jgi:hypothetical protein